MKIVFITLSYIRDLFRKKKKIFMGFLLKKSDALFFFEYLPLQQENLTLYLFISRYRYVLGRPPFFTLESYPSFLSTTGTELDLKSITTSEYNCS